MARVTAVFDNTAQAERAVTELRRRGVSDAQLSFVARREGTVETRSGAEGAGERAGKGALAGAGVGALFGLAAALIPGIGPFVTAGALASALGVTGGAVASGAIVGGVSGGIAGALTKAGFTREEAEYYGPAVERGDVLVAVDTTTAGVTSDSDVRSVLEQHGGRTYRR
jgi:heat induced stress protein YflT